MLPNFLIVGAPRGGTTSLFYYCNEHPEIFMSPIKEPVYFSSNARGYSLRDYEALFDSVKSEKAVGEVSPCYLRYPEAPGRIKRAIPECKIVIILRNPVDRFFSGYKQSRMFGHNQMPLEDILRDPAASADCEQWSLDVMIERGRYYGQVKRYIDTFGRENVLICTHDDLRADAPSLMRHLYRFLGVDEAFVPAVRKRYNASGKPRLLPLSRFIAWFVEKPNRLRSALLWLIPMRMREPLWEAVCSLSTQQDSEVLRPETRQYLLDLYREDVRSLQSLLGWDLARWLE